MLGFDDAGKVRGQADADAITTGASTRAWAARGARAGLPDGRAFDAPATRTRWPTSALDAYAPRAGWIRRTERRQHARIGDWLARVEATPGFVNDPRLPAHAAVGAGRRLRARPPALDAERLACERCPRSFASSV